MVSRVERHWSRARLGPAAYDFGVKHGFIARPYLALVLGSDSRRLDSEFERIAERIAGREVLDVPCGGGIAFRAIGRPGPRRYVAADLSPTMLQRARAEAKRLELGRIEFAEANLERLPFETASFDVCVSYNGLHCLPRPAAALEEIARVTRGGGALHGSTVVRGLHRRADATIALYRRLGVFGEVPNVAELQTFLRTAGFEESAVEHNGGLAYFSGRRREG
jgi:ubiquinone/menaquinone biosynthesis C-methylase UbiE